MNTFAYTEEQWAAEDIRVDAWNGSSWTTLFTDLSTGWNNVTVSSYLTSSTFTIRFKGSNETGDTTPRHLENRRNIS